MAKPSPTVRVINPTTRWVAFGEYHCGVEYEVTAEVAAHLAARGFVPVAPLAPPAPAPLPEATA